MAIAGATSGSFTSRAPRLGFIGGFDGIRGIGIMMVLSNHAYSALSPSFAGIIDVFFAMSAFLIVTLLIQEHGENGRIDMRKFYARRGLRLLPSVFLCFAAWILVTALFDRERLVWVLQDVGAAGLYVYNLVFPVGLFFVDPVSASHRSMDPFWSLAVEEQFYLVIAITVLVAMRRRWMVQLAVGLCILAAWIGYQRWTGHAGPWNGGVPTNSSVPARGLSLLWLSRYDSLMWGFGLAVLNAKLPDPLPRFWRKWLPWLGALGLVVGFSSMLLASGFLKQTADKLGLPYPYVPMMPDPASGEQMTDGTYWISFGHSVTAIAFLPVLLVMARHKDWWANRMLSWKPLRFLGRMSYTMYVWHTFFYFVLLDLLGLNSVLGEKTRVPILAAAVILLSLPIYYGVEKRVLRRKLRFASEQHVVDLTTGKMVQIDASGTPVVSGTEHPAPPSGPDEPTDLVDDPEGDGSTPAGSAVSGGDTRAGE
jgi:peptidoglycan/LPS O-acetylase OafA/YrhL